ncbi:MAG: 3-dehydroquinate synthase [Bacteroidales bacterium]|jgi:3-dehydroquinate synthase
MVQITQNNSSTIILLKKIIDKNNFKQIVIITDNNSKKYCLKDIESAFKPNNFINININPGEKEKNLTTCINIWQTLINNRISRHSLIIGIGGGVICDIVGFIANTYKRGVNYMLIPTTLLAQIDATIGGKNGINFNSVKNSIGTFGKPQSIIINTSFLSTLSNKEFTVGLTEVVKYGIIAENSILKSIETGEYKYNIYDLIKKSVNIKNDIVKKDFYDLGLRKSLNFGHTIGHGIESVYNYNVSHGEAVAFGMIGALLLSSKVLNYPKAKCTNIIELIKNNLILPEIKDDDIPHIIEKMENDKKNNDGKIMFVLLDNNCDIKIDVPINTETLQDIIRETIKLCS